MGLLMIIRVATVVSAGLLAKCIQFRAAWADDRQSMGQRFVFQPRASSVQLPKLFAGAAELSDDVAHKLLGVAEQHQGVIEVIQRIVDSGEAGGHAAFDDHDGVGFVNVQNWHTVDRATLCRCARRDW